MSRNFAKLKNIETLRKVNLRKKIQDDLNNIKVRVIVIGIILALLFSALPLFNEHGRVSAASFDGDYRVDDTGTGTTIQWIPSIARSSNGDVNVAWYDNRGGNGSGVFFSKSSDGGKTFGTSVLVNDSTTNTYTVFVHNNYVAVDNSGGANDGNIYMIWEDLRNDWFWQQDYDIYFARSTDSGTSFGTNLKIIDEINNTPQVRPQVTVDNSGNIYAVWTDLRDTVGMNTDLNIYFAKSTNGGTSFGTNKRVDDGGTNVAECATIAVNETGVIYVAWHDTRNGNADIYMSKSIDGGSTFGNSVRVSKSSFTTSGKLSFPQIAASGKNVYVTWGDNQSGNWDIRMAYSTNGGSSWSTPVKVNDDGGSAEQFYPDIDLDDNSTIYVAWHDKRNGDYDIYYANSTNGGSSFGTNTRVNHDTGSATQRYTSIVAEPTGGIYLAWEDWRDDSDGKFVSGGGADGVNDANIYLASGGKYQVTFAPSAGKPPTPENLKVALEPAGSALDITWDKLNVLDLANYTLYWSMDGSTYGKLVDIPANATSLRYTHTDLTNGLTYYFKISVWDNNGNESNLSLAVANIPDIDTDLDGVGNENDWDDDGDGVADFDDDFALDVDRSKDTDSDGLDDTLDDLDDDNDGYSDFDEIRIGTNPLSAGDKPSDFDSDYIPDVDDADIDNDGTSNTNDDLDYNPYETVDSDFDGFGNNSDQDDDNDGILDYFDAFPDDLLEWDDTDGDGKGDNADTDDDNDGVPDISDAFPRDDSEWEDTDSDGLGDNFDTDDDGDGVTDDNDAFPKLPTESEDTDSDGIGNNADTDDDNDTHLDSEDAFPLDRTEWEDTDTDGLGDNFDTDDDGDTYPDLIEEYCGTDPKDPLSFPTDSDLDDIPDDIDTDDDNDGVTDDNDAFPNDPQEQVDTDSDGVGDLADTDDDNDKVADGNDQFPLDPSEWQDTDSDGLGDNFDPDDDNDGVRDDNDAFPDNPSEWEDTDSDGIGDDHDPDDDNDGYPDNDDVFPGDPSEWEDTDSDGLGDNSDADDDNDGVTDDNDAFPKDETEWKDTDSDGLGDNTDTNDDDDSVDDMDDLFPIVDTEWVDTDSDGLGNNLDDDDDGDGVLDTSDAFPLDPTEWKDNDYDDKGDNADDDDDNDGVMDLSDRFPEDPTEYIDSDDDGIGDNIDADDDNDGVIDVHDDYPLDKTRSKEPEGVSELWIPILLIIIFVVLLLVLISIVFHIVYKHTRKINSDFLELSDTIKHMGSGVFPDSKTMPDAVGATIPPQLPPHQVQPPASMPQALSQTQKLPPINNEPAQQPANIATAGEQNQT